MGKIKISTLPKDTIVLVDGYSTINTVADILEDLEFYKNKEVYTTIPYSPSFDAKSIIDNAIEYEYENGMYEDWDQNISADITSEDIAELQVVFDRILARSPGQNIAYNSDKLIEIDVLNLLNQDDKSVLSDILHEHLGYEKIKMLGICSMSRVESGKYQVYVDVQYPNGEADCNLYQVNIDNGEVQEVS